MNMPFETSGADPQGTLARPVAYDQGLRRYMLGIYRTMTLGLALTGLVALVVASSPAFYQPIFNTPLKWVVILAPLAFVLFFSFRVEQMSVASARITFYAFAAVMGLSLASIFLVFAGTSIALAFFSAAALFATMCLWGYTTSTDLSRWSTLLMVGLVGLVVASLVNLFLASDTLQFAVSIVGVLVFTGLTAWDSQRLKSQYFAYAGTESTEKLAVMGALSLYLDLINLFQLLLNLTGERQRA